MADKLYVWSEIRHGEPGDGDKPGATKVFKRGESVSKSDFAGISDEEFAGIVEGGSLRKMKYPDMPETYQGSPIDFMREQAKLAAENAMLDSDVGEAISEEPQEEVKK